MGSRSWQYPFSNRESRRSYSRGCSETKTEMGLRISRSRHRLCLPQRFRRKGLCGQRGWHGLFAQRPNRMHLLDLSSGRGRPNRHPHREQWRGSVFWRPAGQHVRRQRQPPALFFGKRVWMTTFMPRSPERQNWRTAGFMFLCRVALNRLPPGNPSYQCCTFRGSLVALDAASGKQIWKSYTISEPAKPTGKSAAGTPKWGPSGVALWSSPTVDLASQSDLCQHRRKLLRSGHLRERCRPCF